MTVADDDFVDTSSGTPATRNLLARADTVLDTDADLLKPDAWSTVDRDRRSSHVSWARAIEAMQLSIVEYIAEKTSASALLVDCNCWTDERGRYDCADRANYLKWCLPNTGSAPYLCQEIQPASSSGKRLCGLFNQRPCNGLCSYNCALTDEYCVQTRGKYYIADSSSCTCIKWVSPLLVAGDHGYSLTGVAGGVSFDLDADGVVEQTAWTEAGADDAFLVLDRNGNGNIDDGSELFGNLTPKTDGSIAVNGFDALTDLDGGPQSDGAITKEEPQYSKLKLWTDLNHDGVSQPDELTSLEARQITTIFTSYQRLGRKDIHGNQYRYQGHLLLLKENGQEVARKIYDVFFVTSE
jgi:hypothetical protein